MSKFNPDQSLTSMDWLTHVNVGKTPEDDGKPQYSYATLISFAINSHPDKRMTLAEIYDWIQDNYTYFKSSDKGWKNSVRHNLSLSKMFKKVQRESTDPGKGCFWAMNDDYDPDSDDSKTSTKKRKKEKGGGEPKAKSAAQTTKSGAKTSVSSSTSVQSQASHASVGAASVSASGNLLAPSALGGVSSMPPIPPLGPVGVAGQPPLPSTELNFDDILGSDIPLGVFDDGLLGSRNAAAFQDLNASYKSLAQGTDFGAPQTLSYEAMEGVLQDLESRPQLQASVDPKTYQDTMSLFKSVQQDNAAGLSWTKSPHFSHLAQSFGTMLQASGADFLASIDWKSLGTAVSELTLYRYHRPNMPRTQTSRVLHPSLLCSSVT
eukprot:m.76261 g.76261  ORF g.76261 m.76261 type:complete len:377 (+) comp12482_c0_seq7:173-1303(+)